MDSERAERHLRLTGEAALRRALTPPLGAARGRSPDVVTHPLRRLQWAAAALTAVGAVDARRAETIADEFATALSLRQLSPAATRPMFRTGLVSPAGGPGAAAPAAPPPRVIPVGRMLRFRGDNGSGELYLMSLVVTGDQAAVPALARFRPGERKAGAFLRQPYPAFEAMTAADDQGTTYQVVPVGGAMRPGWTGSLNIVPAPPAGALWLELSGGDPGSVRIDLGALAAAAAAHAVTAGPLSAPPAERLLENMVQHTLAAAEFPAMARDTADGVGDVVAALTAAGALSPFSAMPGQLATVCERLGITDHGIAGRPAAALPEPWLSVLACYGRRHPPAIRDGVAAVAAGLPGMDGAQITLAGLHTLRGQTFLHVFGRGLAQALPSQRLGAYPPFGWWLRDDASHWHVVVQRHWEQHVADGEGPIELRVVPPLGPETGSGILFVTTRTEQASVRVPLAWWATP